MVVNVAVGDVDVGVVVSVVGRAGDRVVGVVVVTVEGVVVVVVNVGDVVVFRLEPVVPDVGLALRTRSADLLAPPSVASTITSGDSKLPEERPWNGLPDLTTLRGAGSSPSSELGGGTPRMTRRGGDGSSVADRPSLVLGSRGLSDCPGLTRGVSGGGVREGAAGMGPGWSSGVGNRGVCSC